ncbi:MAG TPA: tRNA lysidine(34) synthetase TilS [Candidatus Saccharimonadales bacterium]
MTEVDLLPAGVYVLAVSGGIDSVVLLDMLAKQPQLELIVAHVNHGIRPDSGEDAVFVQQLAKKYGCRYEATSLQLGASASEEQAREARYAFLKKVQRRHAAKAIITAHHADDVVETILINLIRGTGWRGLCSLRSEGGLVRPLLNVYKQEIAAYAKKHRLGWREDSTNQSNHYLRNYIRLQLLPKLLLSDPRLKAKLHNLWQQQCMLRGKIEAEIEGLYQHIADRTGLKRAAFEQLEPAIADEILRHYLLKQGVRQTIPQRRRALQFAHTALNTKKFSLNSETFLQLRRDHIVVVKVKN